MRRTVIASMGLVVSATALLAVVACSSSTEEQPTPNPVPTSQPTADTGPISTADGGAETGAECLGSEGCYACEVTKLDQALNACTDSQCAPFDNGRLPLLVGGVLPPVP